MPSYMITIEHDDWMNEVYSKVTGDLECIGPFLQSKSFDEDTSNQMNCVPLFKFESIS